MDSQNAGLYRGITFTELQIILDDFLRSRDDNYMVGELSVGIEARRDDLVCPDPSRCYPRNAEDRAALESGNVTCRGYRATLPQEAVPQLLKLSEELNINERVCVDLWSQINYPWQRRNLELKLSEEPGRLVDDLPLSARRYFHLERSNLLMFLSGLLQASLMSELTTAKKTVIEREVSCLLEKGLAPNLMSFVSELLGPEGLRRRSAPASSGATATTSQGATPSSLSAIPASGTVGGAGSNQPDGEDAYTASREEFLLNSLVSSVEILFFIYYSYKIKAAEAMQLVNLLETAGRELLQLKKSVGESSVIQGQRGNLQGGFSGRNGANGGGGFGPFAGFGGSAGLAAAAASSNPTGASVVGMGGALGRGLGTGGMGGVVSGVGGGGGVGVGGEAERQRDLVRLCAVTEVTSVLLCTLAVALNQSQISYDGDLETNMGSTPMLAGGGEAANSGDGGGSLADNVEDLKALNALICERKWDHVQVQGAAQAILGTLLEPFAQARRTFGTVQDSENYLHAVMTSAGATGAVKFLRREVLTTLRRPPFAAQNMNLRAFYLEALSGLASTYIRMALDSSNSCELPTSRDQRLERLHAEWVHKYGGGVLGAGFSQHANGAMATEAAEWVATVVMEDTLEDVMYWTGQLMEAYPELAFKFWEGEPTASLPEYLNKRASMNRELLAPWLTFLLPRLLYSSALSKMSGSNPEYVRSIDVIQPSIYSTSSMALKTPDNVFRLMEASQCGWDFFMENVENITSSLQQTNPLQAADSNGYSVPATRVKLSDRAYVVLEPLCHLLQRVMLDEHVRRSLAPRKDYRVLASLTNLVVCGVKPSLKGAIFKALAACAADAEFVPKLWNFVEQAQLIATGVSGEVAGYSGGGHERMRRGANASYSGLFYELEQVESRDGTYPATEGFCCLLQELVQHDLPYDLGDNRRYNGAGGIQPYISYVQDNVLMPDLRFSNPGERWRITARVLQVMVTLLRRYPLSRIGAGAGAPHGITSLATPRDEEECAKDFQSGPSTQRRCKSPGYYILRQLLGQGGLFRRVIQILREGGGVRSLTSSRVENSMVTVLETVLPDEATGGADGGGESNRYGASAIAATFANGHDHVQATAEAGLVPPGGPGSDWSWWRERSVMLALSLLDAAVEREESFIVRWRERVAAGGLDEDDDTPGGGFGGGGRISAGLGLGGGAGSGGGGGIAGGGTLAPPANLGKLLAEGNTLAAVARYMEYEGNMAIPLLSASLMLSCSRNLPAGTLLNTILASDPGEYRSLAEAYTGCLAVDGAISGSRLLSLEAVLCPPNGEADTDFMSLNPQLIGAGGPGSERDREGEEGVLRTVRLCILDLLLENVGQRGPNLAHLLLGLATSPSSLSTTDSNGPNGSSAFGLSVVRGPASGCATAEPSPSACLGAVVGLLRSPSIIEQEPRLAEKCAHLIYKLCASEDTRVSVLDRLRNVSASPDKEAFFPHAPLPDKWSQELLDSFSKFPVLRIALGESRRIVPTDPKGESWYIPHCIAWLLKGSAIDLRTSCEGNPMHLSHARALLKAFFVGEAPADHESGAGAGAGGAGGGVARFGLFGNSVSGSSSVGSMDQARAPLLTLLETRIDLSQTGPDRRFANSTMKDLMVQAIIPLPPPGGSADAAGQDFRIIDAAYLQPSNLHAASSNTVSAEAQKCVKTALTWAAEWNRRTSRLASHVHLCQAWRQVMEVAFVSAGSLLFGPPQDPSKAVASRRLLPALLLGILRKLWGKHGAEQRLLHPLGRACMFVAGVMRELGASAPLQLVESKQLFTALLHCLTGMHGMSGGPNAIAGGEGSMTYRAFLYGCLIHLLEHTQGKAALVEGPLSGIGVVGAGAASVLRAGGGPAEDVLRAGEGDGVILSAGSGAGSGAPSATVSGVSTFELSHEALRGEHRLQNREFLREHLETLAYLLSSDACYGPSITQCLGLSLLSSVMATLGRGPSAVGAAPSPTPAGAPRNRVAVAMSDETHAKEVRGCQIRSALLTFLHGRGVFVELAKVLKGVRSDSGMDVPGLVMESVIGLLTQVACSAEGARSLLEAGVVERLAESKRLEKASQIAVEAARLGGLGVQMAAPVGEERSTVNFDADGPGSLRVLVIPIFLLLEGLLASLPGNTSLGDQVTRLLARHAKLVHYVLLLKEFDLQGLRAISVVLCVLAHVSKPPFQEMLDEKVGLEMAREWRNSAEDVLIAFAEGPLPHGRPNADTMHWWSRMRPRTPLEEAMANEPCQGPPGGPSEWTSFDTAKLEASQRVLAHAVDVLRWRAAAVARDSSIASRRRWVTNKPEGLCAALRACVENARTRHDGSSGNTSISDSTGNGNGTGTGTSTSTSTGTGTSTGIGQGVGGVRISAGGGAMGAAGGVTSDRCIGRAGSPGDPFLQYVLESLLAALLHLVDVECLGDDQLKKYKNGLVPTLSGLLQDVKNEAFVLRAARILIGRVSWRDEGTTTYGGLRAQDSMLKVA